MCKLNTMAPHLDHTDLDLTQLSWMSDYNKWTQNFREFAVH